MTKHFETIVKSMHFLQRLIVGRVMNEKQWVVKKNFLENNKQIYPSSGKPEPGGPGHLADQLTLFQHSTNGTQFFFHLPVSLLPFIREVRIALPFFI